LARDPFTNDAARALTLSPYERSSLPAPAGQRTGIVLSGGGARGAYQVGVVAGILDVLGSGLEHAPFNVLCGTSVGAINAGYLASHAQAPDLAINGLIDAWQSLKLTDHLRINLRGLVGLWASAKAVSDDARLSERPVQARTLIDSLPLQDLVSTQVDFNQLHENVDRGVVHALVITALEITSGRTTMFIEAPPYVSFPESNDPRRNVTRERIGLQHILASAALPLVFPPRRIHGEAYCDGGVRFNTPIAPAIRAGADRLVVISLLSEAPHGETMEVPEEVREASYKNPVFLIGKVLNALLLDPTHYDLQVLERFNKMIETMERVLEPAQLAEFHRVVNKERNMAYRKLRTLVFRPSRDIGEIALQYARTIKPDGLGPRLLLRLANQKSAWQSDLVSFLCFDGAFAKLLIQLGRSDAVKRSDEIRAFFA
jgi:NTE family protein